MPRKPSPHPTDAELAILQVLWRRGAATVRDVHDELKDERDIGYTTVLKLLQQLLEVLELGAEVGDQRLHLARERNPYLRYWFVQAAHSLKGNQEDYAQYYQRKYHEVKTHQHKRALILTARKAAAAISRGA